MTQHERVKDMSSKQGEKPEKLSASANVKSAARVLSIFEYFERMRMSRTLSEISQDLDYPVSSALALLRSIHAMGYLNYDQVTKAYSPSIRFAMLGQWIHEGLLEGGAIKQMMEHLAELTHETVALGIQSGLQSQHAYIIQTSQPLSYRPEVGLTRPLLRSAVGKVILAHSPKDSVLKIIERINALGVDEGKVFAPDVVMKELASVRKAGFAYSANIFMQGVAIVAVALPTRDNAVPMALSVSGPTTRVNAEIIPKLVKQIKETISEFS